MGRTLNLGILAHVDAGKTSLTERLLHAAGVIDEIGSVDEGSTQTDSLELERQRGITIKSAVVSFEIDDVTGNLIDTPGHPDFIAEVERVLNVLDGAVLVISAVEGVQSQTLVLMRTLQRLRIPTLLFVNKIDRGGAEYQRTLDAIAARLTPAIVAMGLVSDAGTRGADFTPFGADDEAFTARLLDLLAEQDEALLAAYVDDEASVSYRRLRRRLAAKSRQGAVHPVFFGSAITGAGVEALMHGIRDLLPAAEGDAEGVPSGSVFKVERGSAGEKVAYVRMFIGTLRIRERVAFEGRDDHRITAISVFERGATTPRTSVVAGQIGKVWGLGDVRIGDRLGVSRVASDAHFFPPPTLETAIIPVDASTKGALHVALTQLAEQDPLINLRQDDVRQELFLSLYGEVQKEVIQATLATDFGLEVEFRGTTTIHIERLTGTGEAGEILRARTHTNVTGDSSPTSSNRFPATLGLRVGPAPAGSGIELRLDVDVRVVPLYIYKTVDVFTDQMTAYVRETLREGLFGWRVPDCIVTVTNCGYRAPGTTAGDFRKLTPLVLMGALKEAGTVVCEPVHRFRIEVPVDTFGALLPMLTQLRAVPGTPSTEASATIIEGDIPAAHVHALQQQLPGLTRGEGVLEATFDHYEPVRGAPPTRSRTDLNPLDRKEYLLHVLRRV
ncbi:MAG: TetM/TetW/TetO/TetS family tetracycline resistance ribosomal protection protein [Chloroflexi bacterium]|nr:TetM/TetW/TetO/TetS family tetracycline resistance ribosomal protection protein [Chloroflexota bacterium]